VTLLQGRWEKKEKKGKKIEGDKDKSKGTMFYK